HFFDGREAIRGDGAGRGGADPMAPALLSWSRMASGHHVVEPGATLPRDLGTFNRWLNLSRMRAAGGVAIAVTALELMHPGTFALPAVLGICALADVGSPMS